MTLVHLRPGEPIRYGALGIQRRLNIIRRQLDLAGKHLLDVGCGNGAQTLALLDLVARCDAVDTDPTQLAAFAHRLRQQGAAPCTLHQMDAQGLAFPDESFDVVTAIEVLEHLPDHHRALAEMRRVLRPGGWVVLSVPNRWWLFETHGAHLPLLPWHRVPFFSWLPRSIHDRFACARIYTCGDVVALVREHGFLVRHTEHIMPPLDKVQPAPLRRALQALLWPLESTPLRVFGVSVFVFAQRQ